MKKFLKRTLLVLLVIIGIGLLIPVFLSPAVRCENTVTIDAPAENVYELIGNFKNWNRWSAWNNMDPDMKIVYGGQDAGKGSWYTWESEKGEVGKGKATIDAEAYNDSIRVMLEFMESGNPSYMVYRFKKEGTGVKITANFRSEMGYLMRYATGMMESVISEKTGESLNALKKIAEAGPKQTRYEVMNTWQNEQNYLSLRDTCTMATIGAKYGANFGLLGQALAQSGVAGAGPPFAIVHSPDTAQTIFDIEWCIPTAGPAKASGNAKPGTLKAGKVLRVDYYGPYEKTMPAYEALFTYAAGKKLTPAGKVREVYITDPTGENGKMDRILTIILLPVE